jgi:hypothetical protein
MLVLCVAASVRSLRYIRWPGDCLRPDVDANEMSRIAQSIVATGQFANPYPFFTGPTAHHAPVYPLILSFVYRLPAGSRNMARVGLNIFFGSLSCVLVYFAGLALGMRQSTSLIAAFVLALVPPSLAVELCNDQEATFFGALVVAAVLATAAWLRYAPKLTVAFGAFWGFVLLAAPALALVYGTYVLLAARIVQRKVTILILVSATALILMPWLIRDRLVLGKWFFVRDNFGLELRVSNADNALADPSDNAERGAMQTFHPLFNREVAERVHAEGEVAVYSQFGSDAIRWIRSNPRHFVELTIERFRNFWFRPAGRLRMAWRLASLALAAVGLFVLWRTNRTSALLLIFLFSVYPLPYYFLQSYERYQYPVEWAILLLAVHAAVEAARTRSIVQGSRVESYRT